MEISLTVSREDLEAVSEIFESFGTGGVVIEDPALIYEVISGGSRETVAMDISGVDPEAPPLVKGYLQADSSLDKTLSGLLDTLGGISRSYPQGVTLREVEDEDWMNRWREYYHPFRVGSRLMVKPTWEKVEAGEDFLVIEMDPGMAFGCGTHSSTSMCMRLLEDVVSGGEYVIDVGAGSGILAITAVKLGAAGALAVDTDAGAVRTARENVSINGLSEAITVMEANLLEGIDTGADIIVANIVADVILTLIPAAVSLLKTGGAFITSGIISGRSGELENALTSHGLVIKKVLREGEWTAFLAEKAYE